MITIEQFRHERVPRWIGLIVLVGVPLAGLLAGPKGSLGFAIGAAASWWNFRQLQRVLVSLTEAAIRPGAQPNITGRIVWLMLSFLLTAGGVLVILKYSRINLIALLIGLFASCAAVCLEIVYELAYGTRSLADKDL